VDSSWDFLSSWSCLILGLLGMLAVPVLIIVIVFVSTQRASTSARGRPRKRNVPIPPPQQKPGRASSTKALGNPAAIGPSQAGAPPQQPTPMIRFGCPRCKAVLEVQDRRAGDKVPCPRCGQRILVPDAPAPRPAPENATVLGAWEKKAPPVRAQATTPAPPPGGKPVAIPVSPSGQHAPRLLPRLRPKRSHFSHSRKSKATNTATSAALSSGPARKSAQDAACDSRPRNASHIGASWASLTAALGFWSLAS
jgi:DNA-directed RNA polymerase subunit RPC12/RpoP